MWLGLGRIGKTTLLMSVLSLGLCLFAGCALLAADKADVRGGSNVPAGIEVYSDMNFIEDESEFYGIQIVLVTYLDDEKREVKQKVLWRSAGPFLDAPLLLDAIVVGKDLKVVVPDGYGDIGTSGAWILSLRGDSIIATRPKGGGRGFTLKKLTLK